MRKTLNILASSFRLTMQELMVNKLRTSFLLLEFLLEFFASLACWQRLTALKRIFKIKLKALVPILFILINGIIPDGPDYPWWKFVNRPVPKFEEVRLNKERSRLASKVAFEIDTRLILNTKIMPWKALQYWS